MDRKKITFLISILIFLIINLYPTLLSSKDTLYDLFLEGTLNESLDNDFTDNINYKDEYNHINSILHDLLNYQKKLRLSFNKNNSTILLENKNNTANSDSTDNFNNNNNDKEDNTNKHNCEVSIPDINLRKALLKELEKPLDYVIKKSDLESLTNIYAEFYNIKSIEGLQYCINLNTLNLANNNIKDISPISNLNKLQTLRLENQKLSYIPEYSSDSVLINNEIIGLNNTPITNFKNIGNNGYYDKAINSIKIPNINKDIKLNYNFITDICVGKASSIFSGVIKKDILYNYDINIPDINLKKVILQTIKKELNYTIRRKDMESITSLNASFSNVSNIEGLESCINLNYLDLSSNHINNINPLSSLDKFKFINLSNQTISLNDDLFSENPSIKNLIINISNTPVTSIKNISNKGNYDKANNLIKWNKLNEDTNVSYEFSEKISLGSIKTLFNGIVNKNFILDPYIDIKDANLKAALLKQLEKDSDYKIKKSDLENLEDLNASSSDIYSIDELQYCKNLKSLDLSNNHIKDISYLASLDKINNLNLSNQSIKLDEELFTEEAVINNPIINLENKPVKSIIRISDKGLYNEDTNQVIWDNLNTSYNVSYNFAETIELKSVKADFTGIVSKDFIFNPYIKFKDKNLEIAILNELKKDSNYKIKMKDLENLEQLNAASHDIYFIDELQYCKKLKELNLSNNHIENIYPLANLSTLEKINLSNQLITLDDLLFLDEVTIKNTIINLENKPVTSISNISNNGTYDVNKNLIIWDKLHEDVNVSYDFSEDITLGKGTTSFNGTVNKNLFYDPYIPVDDIHLKEALLQSLQKDSSYKIRKSDLEKITVLDAPSKEICSIDVLKYCINLSYLNLSNNCIKDISPLAKLSSLEKLNLENQIIKLNEESFSTDAIIKNPIINLSKSPVKLISNISSSGKYYLETNYIIWNNLNENSLVSYNFFEDITLGNTTSPYSGTVSKQFNYDPYININDLNLKAAILDSLNKDSDYCIKKSDLTNLETLEASSKEIASIDELKYCINLRFLDLSKNEIKNISPLAGLNKLESLNLSDQTIKLSSESFSTTAIAENPIINLNNTPVTGITDIYGEGSYSPETNLVIWHNLTEDTNAYFNFSENIVLGEKSTAFNGKVIKEFIYDPYINIDDEHLKSAILKTLHKNTDYDIKKSDLESIDTLYAPNNNISSINALRYCINLKELDLSNNNISNISPLNGLDKLETLDLSNQTLNLNEELFTEKATVKNPIIALDSTYVAASNISNGGTYDEETNLIRWDNLNYSCKVSYEFSKDINLGNISDAKFTGTVTKSLIYDPYINIKDSNLEAALQNALQKESTYKIKKSDLEGLEKLDAPSYNISSINELRYCINLKELYLNDNHIKDISPLSNLNKLNSLNLNNQIIELDEDSFSEYAFVKNPIITLDNTPVTISNISNNGSYDSETDLILWNNLNYSCKVSYEFSKDINLGNTSSAQFTGTVTKSLIYNPYISIKDSNLETVLLNTLEKDRTYRIKKSDLEKIKEIDAPSYNISSIDELKYCINLEKLNLKDNHIKDISSLKDLNKITDLNLSNQVISLEDEVSDFDDVSIENPIVGLNKESIKSIVDINNEGIYDANSNTVNWIVSDEKTILSYSFSSDLELATVSAKYSGIVKKQVSYDNSLTIPDINFKRLVLSLLKGNDYNIDDKVTKKDMARITSMYSDNQNISSIDGIQYCKNLTWVNLTNNHISDISYLSRLKKIDWLNLNNNAITDLSGISNLENLSLLYAQNNQIEVIPSLTNLKSLNTINLFNNKISDISPFVACSDTLTGLSLGQNEIEDISSVKNMTNLTYLWLEKNKINDISSLSVLKNLGELVIHSNNITDISALSSLNKLTKLWISSNPIDDISPISSLININNLDITHTEVSDISPLRNFEKLNTVRAIGCHISDLSPLSNLRNLSQADFSNQIIVSPTCLESSGEVEFENNIKNIDGNTVTPEDLYLDSGNIEYSNNIFKCTNINKNTNASFNFKVENKIPNSNIESGYLEFTYSGYVTQQIIYKNK